MNYCLLLPALLCALFTTRAAYAEPLPRPNHVVIVIEENKSFAQILNMQHANSFINQLAQRGMLFTQSYGVTHPSQPNYLALFAGDTQGVSSNACGYSFSSDTLASALQEGGFSFASYAEGLPDMGSLACMNGAYQRKHNPVSNWQGTRLPATMNLPFSEFPQDFAKLPTVALVIPDQNNDMHDGSFEAADDWLKTHIEPYVDWAFKHNSLLILTWDEGNDSENNRVVTLFIGPMVKVGTTAQRINHYNVLRTLLDFYQLPSVGASSTSTRIKNVWKGH
ncbi:MAG: alkaline phosphatase family protein [Gallionella sp.]